MKITDILIKLMPNNWFLVQVVGEFSPEAGGGTMVNSDWADTIPKAITCAQEIVKEMEPK